VLLGVFGAIGALCSLLAALIVVGWQVGRRRLYRDVGWTVGLTMGALLPPVYLAAAAAVESGTFKHVVSAKHYARYAPAAIGGDPWRHAGGLAALLVGAGLGGHPHRSFAGRERSLR